VSAGDPVEHLGPAGLVRQGGRHGQRGFEIGEILLEVLPGERDPGQLERCVDLRSVALGRDRQLAGQLEGLIVVGPGLGVGVEAGGTIPGHHGVRDAAGRLVAPCMVVRDDAGLLRQPVGVEFFESAAHGPMQFLPAATE